MKSILKWTNLIPILSWILVISGLVHGSAVFQAIAAVLLILSVMAAVHHSEIIAHRVGEPFGTIILAVSVTIIEVSIIISLMVTGAENPSLARDTVFSATMLILNGIIGSCLLIGALKYKEQTFSINSVTIGLVALISIIVLTLVFPSFTSSVAGPYYSTPQLLFVSATSLIIYSFYLLAQTKRDRSYFVSVSEQPEVQHEKISNLHFTRNLVFLLVSLSVVVILAEELTPTVEMFIAAYDLPDSMVGIIIAAVILLPESISALSAANKNRIQKSLNLALGSALASAGLTLPAVAIASRFLGLDLIFGLDIKAIILLGLSVFIVLLSLITGKTNLVYGVVLMVNLLAFLFMIIFP